MVSLRSYADFAAVAERVRAPALAEVLRQTNPSAPFAPIALTDKRTALTKFRAVLKQETGVVVLADQIGPTWSYLLAEEWGNVCTASPICRFIQTEEGGSRRRQLSPGTQSSLLDSSASTDKSSSNICVLERNGEERIA